jgi:PKD repeat protein
MAPAASFKASRISGYAPLDVNFANISRKATSYLWSFGDSSPSSSEVSPSHTFTSPGEYTVTLNASSLAGSTTKSVTINVLSARPDLSVKLVRKTSKRTGRLRLTSFSATLGDKGGATDERVKIKITLPAGASYQSISFAVRSVSARANGSSARSRSSCRRRP